MHPLPHFLRFGYNGRSDPDPKVVLQCSSSPSENAPNSWPRRYRKTPVPSCTEQRLWPPASPRTASNNTKASSRSSWPRKSFEGADGLAVTDEMRLCIAGQAALLQLHHHADYYPGLDTILVYPEPFTVDHEHHDDSGLVTQEEADLSGESWQRGVVILAWSDVQSEAASQNGYNVVLHEFAHQLDDQTGTADGTPLLPNADLGARWSAAFQKALETHRDRLECDRHVLFDEDSAVSPTEFFATAVELFFEFPDDLSREYPAVYAVLAEYLELDPLAW